MIKLSRLSKELIERILADSIDFANGKAVQATQPIYVSNLFFESSTRTVVSFDMAERRLGLQVVPFNIQTSSLNKGETLLDTVKTLKALGLDLLVIRHPDDRYYNQLKDLDISIINAGDGTGHHPSQGLLDLMTIKQEFGSFQGLTVGIIGDVKHSRVANSDADALRRLGAKVHFSGPEDWFDHGSMMNGTYRNFDHLIPEVDVLIMLRIQHERHRQKFHLSPGEYHQRYGLTLEREKKMKPGAIIMHPGPINQGVEIAPELVESPRSRIFKQIENGVFTRMAILKNALEQRGFSFKEIN